VRKPRVLFSLPFIFRSAGRKNKGHKQKSTISPSMPEMDEDAPEIAIIFLNPVVQRSNVRLVEKP
jgi:hypothetical protein